MTRLRRFALGLISLLWLSTGLCLAGSGGGGTTTTTTTTTTVNSNQGTINAGSIYEGHVTVSGAINAALNYSWGQLKVSQDVLNQLRGQVNGTSSQALTDFFASAGASLPSNLELLTASGSVPFNNPYLYYTSSGDVNRSGYQDPTTFNGADVLGIESYVIGGRTAVWNPNPTTSQTYMAPIKATNVTTSERTQEIRVGDFVIGTNKIVDTTTTNYTGQAQVTVYQVSGSKYVSPIVLDLSGQGRIEASNGEWLPHPARFDRKHVAVFDFNANGFEVMMEWVGPNDGLLVEPKMDGSVDGSCLFGTTGGYLNGFEKLAARDASKDQKLTGKELEGLFVWQDKNGNARADEGELRSVASLGITEVRLNHTNYRSTFVMNGGTRVMWDWWPTALNLKKVRVADLQP